MSISVLFVSLLCVFPMLISGQPGPDNLVIDECLDDFLNIGGEKLSGIPKACVTGTISRCDTVNATLHITIGNSYNQTVHIGSTNMDPNINFSIPSSICNNGARGTFHIDATNWKLTPSYLRIHPSIQFQPQCKTCIPPGSPICFYTPQIARDFSVGTDCSTATTCDTCASRTEVGNSHPCGWCQSSQTCFPANPQHQPYCTGPCTTTGGLAQTHAQCIAAVQGQTTNDSTWSSGKTATVVILAIVLPILAIIVALCLRRAYVRHRAQKGATSGVNSIQAHTQGYRPTSESVSTEVSTNASTNAEFRQLEGYNPPSTRA